MFGKTTDIGPGIGGSQQDTMANQTLIVTIVVGLGLAFVFGAVAHRLRIPL